MATAGGMLPPPLEIPSSSDVDQKKLWRKWKQKFQSYLLVSGLSGEDEKLQLAAFVTALDSALDVYNALHFNDELGRKSLKKTLELMENHYAGEKDTQKIRLCIDPKPLNRALKRSIYPLPTLEDVLPKLAKAKVEGLFCM